MVISYVRIRYILYAYHTEENYGLCNFSWLIVVMSPRPMPNFSYLNIHG